MEARKRARGAAFPSNVCTTQGGEMASYPYISTTSSATLPTGCISSLGSGSTFCPISHLRNLRRPLDTQSSLRMKPVNDQLQQQGKKLYSQKQHFGETNRMSGVGQSQNILKEDNNQSARLQLQRQEQNNPSVERSRTYPGFNVVCTASADGVEKLHELLRTYHHARSCEDNGKKCEYRNCKHMKFHLFCISRCRAGPSCHEKYCSLFRKFFSRHQNCREGTCNLCFPGKVTLRNNFQVTIDSNAIEPISSTHTTIGTMEQKRPPSKRTKSSHDESSRVSIPAEDPLPSFPEENIVECKKLSTPVDVTSKIIKQDPVLSLIPSKDNIAESCMVKTGEPVMDIEMNPCLESLTNVELSDAQADNEKVQVSVEADDVRLKGDCMSSAETDVCATKTKPGKLKNGISLIESLPPEIIREHLNSLKQPVVQSGHEMDKDTCSLCRMNDLRYDPPPRYCALCANRINLDGACYSVKTNLEKLICPACFARRGKDAVDGKSISKSELVKIDDYASTLPLSEPLAQCQKCGSRQHQTCALVNPKRLEAMKGNYICPNCILQEIETGEHLRSTMLGAKDLPTTILSDHLERWVLRRLNEERRQRVTSSQQNISEVPTAEGLVVRVVSSVDLESKIKPAFRELFSETEYPSGFPYKYKAIVLFQNIDGADVIIFIMYVQEYGSECAGPNGRRVYISYLDSVKYFRPEVKAVTGEALRTFVYQEMLLGYIDYCKKRGFNCIDLWACPPSKGDDYILYWHPKSQKTPRDRELLKWYETVILKALGERIAVKRGWLYDHFFLKKECKITATRLPYYHGDYWPWKAEEILEQIKENDRKADDRSQRACKRGHDDIINNRKDTLLMEKLGESIVGKRKNFITIYLCHFCKHCDRPISSGKQWVCNDHEDFRLCDRCYLLEQNGQVKDGRQPSSKKKKLSFYEVQGDENPAETIEDDESTQNEIFETRLKLLDYCEKNKYQFSTLQRAKHSTMMILYNLHKHEWVRDTATRDHKSEQVFQNLSSASLLHFPNCRVPRCEYPFCQHLKGLAHHTINCKTSANGGCRNCRNMWALLFMHARSCNNPECLVLRCRDLKKRKR